MKRITIIMLAAALLLGTAVPTQAEERTAEKVVVTAGRIAQDMKEVPQAVTLISSEEIEKNQYTDMGDLLRNYGLQVFSLGSSQSDSQLQIRGMTTPMSNPMDSDILLLVNGRPLGGANLSMIPMAGIAQVEILRGPAAVQYGTSAAGGVVNIITKRGGENFEATAEFGIGSFDAYRAQGGVSGSGSGLDFVAAVNYSIQHNDYETGQGKTYPDTSNDGRADYLLNLGYTFANEHRLGLLLMGSEHKDMGVSQEFSKYTSDPNATYPYVYGSAGVLDRTNNSIDVTYEGGYHPAGLSWKLLYYNAEDDYKISYTPWFATNYGYGDNKQEYNTQGVQGQLSWKWNILTLTGGLEWSDSDYTSTYSGYSAIYNTPKYEQENMAGFLLAKVALLDETLFLTGGVRYDQYEFSVEGKTEDLDNVALSAGIAYNPLDWLTLRANIGESFKVPSGIHVVGYESTVGKYYGNSELEPEEGFGWDIGFEINYNGFSAALTYFSTDYENFIGTEPYFDGTRYVNKEGTSKIRGIEGLISYDIGRPLGWDFMLQPYLNFTRMLKYDDGDGVKISRIRDLIAAFGINYDDPNIGLNVDLRFTYLGDQKEVVYDNMTYTPSYIEMGGDTLVDLFVTKTLYEWDDWGKLSVKGEIRNMFDHNYAHGYGYPMPGRSFYLGLKYEY